MSAQTENFRPTMVPATLISRSSAGTEVPQSSQGSAPILLAAAGSDLPTASRINPSPMQVATPWGVLSLLAETLDDLERTRIAAENRTRSLAQVYDLAGTPAHQQAESLADAIKALEHGAELQLKRALRRHPLGPWVKQTIGVGEKQGARLLTAIGDPYWNSLHDRPRTVSELWAYCGYHVLRMGQGRFDTQASDAHANKPSGADQLATDAQSEGVGVAATRRRGALANWSATAKMRAYLVAESCIKQAASPYRAVYDAGRVKYADSTHGVECPRCGPKGSPALVGSPLSAGHQHARAMRLVSKALLRDLWIEAKRLHEVDAP